MLGAFVSSRKERSGGKMKNGRWEFSTAAAARGFPPLGPPGGAKEAARREESPALAAAVFLFCFRYLVFSIPLLGSGVFFFSFRAHCL